MLLGVKGKSSKRNFMSPSGKCVWFGGFILSYSESGRSSSDTLGSGLARGDKWFASVWRRRKFLTDILCKNEKRETKLREKVLRSTRRKRNWGEMREGNVVRRSRRSDFTRRKLRDAALRSPTLWKIFLNLLSRASEVVPQHFTNPYSRAWLKTRRSQNNTFDSLLDN